MIIRKHQSANRGDLVFCPARVWRNSRVSGKPEEIGHRHIL